MFMTQKFNASICCVNNESILSCSSLFLSPSSQMIFDSCYDAHKHYFFAAHALALPVRANLISRQQNTYTLSLFTTECDSTWNICFVIVKVINCVMCSGH